MQASLRSGVVRMAVLASAVWIVVAGSTYAANLGIGSEGSALLTIWRGLFPFDRQLPLYEIKCTIFETNVPTTLSQRSFCQSLFSAGGVNRPGF